MSWLAMEQIQSRVLIVDPDTPFTAILKSRLSTEGFDVTVVDRITKAAQMIKDVSFGCIVMDEALPEIKGYEAIPIIKALDPDIPIIMTTRHNTQELELKIREQDVFFYHCKAFAMHELHLAIGNAIKKYETEKRNKETFHAKRS